MSVFFTSHPSPVIFKSPSAAAKHRFEPHSPSFLSTFSNSSRTQFPSLRFSYSNFSGDLPDPPSSKSPINPTSKSPKSEESPVNASPPPASFVDEWGEKTEPETDPSTKLLDSDPPQDDDEWGGVAGSTDEYLFPGNGGAVADLEDGDKSDDKLWELKRCLVDTVYDTNFGFRASPEVRAETLELVSQLEAANPTPAPTEAAEILDGNWVLLYTAFSELLPLLAAGSTPLLKVDKICQEIDTRNLTIENSTSFSSPVAALSFSASATFEVRSPSRIQVEFNQGILKPPEIKPTLNFPRNVDIFGQQIDLLPLQQSLNPLQAAVAGIAGTISGQPPLKFPIPGERTKSWLLITYLDKDLRISRGDGGLFVLAREGSTLLYQ